MSVELHSVGPPGSADEGQAKHRLLSTPAKDSDGSGGVRSAPGRGRRSSASASAGSADLEPTLDAWVYVFLDLLVPAEVSLMVPPENKGTALGAVMFVSAIAGAVASPFFGTLSDHSHSRFGRRRPYLVVGVGCSFVFLYGMMVSHDIVLYGTCFSLVLLFLSMAGAAFNGLVADLVAPSQRGVASGVMGCLVGLGGVTGAALGYLYNDFGQSSMYFCSYGLLAGSTVVTVVTTPEQPLSAYRGRPVAPRPTCGEAIVDIMKPFRNNDFRWVFLTRMMVQMGIYTVQEFLLFYIRDAIELPDDLTPEGMLSFMMVSLLFFGLISPVIAGWVSDRMGGRRKLLVYAAGTFMIASDFAMGFIRVWEALPVMSGVFGLAMGAFNAVDFAMALDVLPNEEDAAKDLGLWNLALVIPMTIAAPIAGFVLDAFNGIEPNLGYSALFVLSASYMAMGIIAVKRVKKVK